MANLIANVSFDIDDISFNRLTNGTLFNNSYLTIHGITYKDNAIVGTEYGSAVAFGGYGMNAANGRMTSGTVTGFVEIDPNTLGLYWGIENINYSAVVAWNAVLTPGVADDYFIIETVFSGNDTIELSDYADKMNGYAGNDTIFGYGGNDTLDGGAGNDLLIGGTGNDILLGGAGNDTLDGGAGNDSMAGGAGNDTYVVNATGDKVFEAANAGTDTVRSSISYTLTANVENLVLTGSAKINGTGNALNNQIAGNGAANKLSGGAGNDTLLGGAGNDTLDGGAGNDSMVGGAGNDTYVVNASGDKVVEAANAGTDTVQSSISYTLGANVENLVLTGSGAINGTGNALNNVITGNGAANTLRGGAGNDTLNGGAGNDVLVGGAGNDRLSGGAGKDIFHFDSKTGSDTVTDFKSVDDTFRFSQAGLRIGDGDTTVDGFAVRNVSGGFSAATEVVVFTPNAASLTATGAAKVIGSASSSFAAGDTRLFVVDNGADSGIFLFTSSSANAQVSASELTLLATFNGISTVASDYVFSA